MAAFWLAYKDASGINASGRNPEKKPLVPFMLLTPIGYLWRRASVTGSPFKLLWIFLGCVLVFVIVEAAVVIPQ